MSRNRNSTSAWRYAICHNLASENGPPARARDYSIGARCLDRPRRAVESELHPGPVMLTREKNCPWEAVTCRLRIDVGAGPTDDRSSARFSSIAIPLIEQREKSSGCDGLSTAHPVLRRNTSTSTSTPSTACSAFRTFSAPPCRSCGAWKFITGQRHAMLSIIS